MIKKIKEKKIPEDFIADYYKLISLSYEAIAIGYFVLYDDLKKSKESFYLGAKIQEILFKKYDDKTLKIDPSFVTMSNYLRLLWALLSDCEELVISFAKLIGGRVKEEKRFGHPFTNNVGYALKYILLKDYEKANEHVNKLEKMGNQKNMKLHLGYGIALRGILNSDKIRTNEGLNHMLESHKKMRSHKNQPEELFSVPVLGFGKLALREGIEVEVDDPIAPKRYFEKIEINYPELDFIEK